MNWDRIYGYFLLQNITLVVICIPIALINACCNIPLPDTYTNAMEWTVLFIAELLFLLIAIVAAEIFDKEE